MPANISEQAYMSNTTQDFVSEAQGYARDYFAANQIEVEDGLQIALEGEILRLRVYALEHPANSTFPPILYLDLVIPPSIVAMVATANPWEDGITEALDRLIGEARQTIQENRP
jgi:hypothetical protein